MRIRYLLGTSWLMAALCSGCGGGGGGDDGLSCSASPAPHFTTTPPTQVTAGQIYRYNIGAVHECGFLPFVCRDVNVLQMPSGAVFEWPNVITWTPSLSQGNSSVNFAVATVPDFCGNSATQSWAVSVLPDITPPTITSVSPANGGVNFPVNSSIYVNFSERINPQTVTTASFLVSGPSGSIAGNVPTQVTCCNASFTPSANLPTSSTITATITTAVTDVAGNALTSNYTWTFSTGVAGETDPPTVPTGLSTVRVSGSEVDLSWISSVDNVAVGGYKIYRDGAYLQSVTNLALLSASDTGLNLNTPYCYTVSAFDWSGNESVQSSPLCVTTLDFLPGNVATWGRAYRTDGTFWERTIPDVIADLSSVSAISHGLSSLAVKSDGTVWQWDSLPTQVPNISNVTAVAGGGFHFLAVKSDGSAWAWGSTRVSANAYLYGQLGDGTTNPTTTPVQMLNLSQVAAVAGGSLHSLALKSDGTVWATGANYWGQLGDGTTNGRTTAIQVPSLRNVIAIAASGTQSLALKSDGTVWAWGGTGYTSYLSTPTQVPGISNVIAISQGVGFTLAAKADGTVWAWGGNISGQLGDGTNTNRTAPVQVTGITNVIAVAGGGSHSMALKADGTVWAWGYNGNGQLGDGTTISKNVPVQVLRVNQVKAIAAGQSTSLALR